MSSSGITLSALSYAHPDGTIAVQDLDAVVPAGRIGLVGRNGSGKTTLLRLIAGELRPTSGSSTVRGRVAYLPQDVTLDPTVPVDSVLGIGDVRKSLRRIESGSFDDRDFEVVADRWDIEDRALALMHRVGLDRILHDVGDFDRTVGQLSGGETVLLAFTARLLDEPDALLLDEPTNNLDADGRARLQDALDRFPGTVLVAGHDRELLDRMDSIAELRNGALRLFGGGFGEYERIVAEEQEAARAAVRDARNDVRRQARELAAAHVTLARRQRYGQKMYEQKREPKIVMGARKRQAQESAGRFRREHEEDLTTARENLDRAKDAVRDDPEIRIDLPGTAVPPGRRVADAPLEIVGPERIALRGPNGSGKTTLLHRIVEAEPHVPFALLPQRLDIFDDDRSVAENAEDRAPHLTPQQVRARLARFLFRGRHAEVAVGALSGGERLRAALAIVLAADPAPQLLLLDEPTNNLDLAGLAHLTQALRAYSGALVVVSHDERFLEEVEVDRSVELGR
ncbi:ATP-binding cassette domain-containing protein [Rhodococcus pyridinivorans]|uniref:ABC-F family ATP-binding cassette domain-containing protein n=1 Tax=Rhodococcus pyridinivorans TaxID=103816 RepID=UPI0020C673D0|nr:ATP-binding cassette domain-containing protein [Rhodococcus pyridinivorans]UTM36700.1 ATP-binding cassette domain-containing protein [Rhodococcus pyridinivorans]